MGDDIFHDDYTGLSFIYRPLFIVTCYRPYRPHSLPSRHRFSYFSCAPSASKHVNYYIYAIATRDNVAIADAAYGRHFLACSAPQRYGNSRRQLSGFASARLGHEGYISAESSSSFHFDAFPRHAMYVYHARCAGTGHTERGQATTHHISASTYSRCQAMM